MGWREFRRWLREMNADRRRDAEAQTGSPHTWRGADDWWPSNRR